MLVKCYNRNWTWWKIAQSKAVSDVSVMTQSVKGNCCLISEPVCDRKLVTFEHCPHL
jgi:hypothetical protein